jgi:hypothetical protein
MTTINSVCDADIELAKTPILLNIWTVFDPIDVEFDTVRPRPMSYFVSALFNSASVTIPWHL